MGIEHFTVSRAADHFVLPVADRPVTQLCIDYAVTLHLAGDVTLRVEQPFVVVDADRQHTVVPDADPSNLMPVLLLARSVVSCGAAFDDGRIELTFTGGIGLEVPPHEEYEAWELTTAAGLRIVSGPGGGLSVWSPSDV